MKFLKPWSMTFMLLATFALALSEYNMVQGDTVQAFHGVATAAVVALFAICWAIIETRK